MIELPIPAPDAIAHSEKLVHLIHDELTRNHGFIPFARFMELALYAPGLGYYSAGTQKFGATGDFVTAPEISPLFSQCLARQCQQVLEQLDQGIILELGAGSGVMAADILSTLEQQKCLPERYLILEVSAELQQRQRTTLAQRIPHLLDKVEWLTTLPLKPINGIILANEVADALPVQRFIIENNACYELYVGYENDQFIWHKMPASAELIKHLPDELLNSQTIYSSEINLMLPGWIKSLSQALQKGLILLIDYGFPQRELYHPDRYMGTLMCHYRHHAHSDPFWLPGLQDITAHVDFTAIAESAHKAGLEVSGYTHQAAFLLGTGLLEFAQNFMHKLPQQLVLSQQIQILTSPSEMGELFKIIGLTRDFYMEKWLGFSMQDRRMSL